MEHLRWRTSVNEREFIETALQSDLRVDGRHSFDFRKLRISFGRYIDLHASPTLRPFPVPAHFRSALLLWVSRLLLGRSLPPAI